MSRNVKLLLCVAASLLVFCGLSYQVQADWIDNFDQPTFDARWGEDEPDPGRGFVNLDTVGDLAHFGANTITNMWNFRDAAPILWTTPPAGPYSFETHVLTDTAQNLSVAGITVYGDGVAPDDGEKPNFSLGLDHWSGGTNRFVKMQGLGNNNPNVFVSALGGQAWLRLNVVPDGGAGGLDRYIAEYKLSAGDPWSTLHTLDRDVPNARVGLVMKTGDGGRSADFSYAALTTPPVPPHLTPVQAWDFESGDLTGWNPLASGVPGDNLVFTTPGNMPTSLPVVGTFNLASIQGNYFIRTWEGETLVPLGDDSHTGVIETPSFVLPADAQFDMVVGGGNHPFVGDPDTIAPDMAAVTLERQVGPSDWETALTATGINANNMVPVSWDASAFAGETVRLRIYDTHQGGWGHIDVDNIVMSTPTPTAPLAAGDVIKLDFSTAGDGDGGSLADWNQVGGDGSDIVPGHVIRHGDATVVEDVAIDFTNFVVGNANDDDNADGWGGEAGDPYFIPAANDIYYHGNTADLSVTFSGLDPSLQYNVRIYSLINNQSTLDGFVVTDGAGTLSVQNRRNERFGAATLEDAGTVFTGLSVNANNEIVVTVEDIEAAAYPLNAIVLEVVPEPSALLLLAIGLVGLLGRRRR